MSTRWGAHRRHDPGEHALPSFYGSRRGCTRDLDAASSVSWVMLGGLNPQSASPKIRIANVATERHPELGRRVTWGMSVDTEPLGGLAT